MLLITTGVVILEWQGVHVFMLKYCSHRIFLYKPLNSKTAKECTLLILVAYVF